MCMVGGPPSLRLPQLCSLFQALISSTVWSQCLSSTVLQLQLTQQPKVQSALMSTMHPAFSMWRTSCKLPAAVATCSQHTCTPKHSLVGGLHSTNCSGRGQRVACSSSSSSSSGSQAAADDSAGSSWLRERRQAGSSSSSSSRGGSRGGRGGRGEGRGQGRLGRDELTSSSSRGGRGGGTSRGGRSSSSPRQPYREPTLEGDEQGARGQGSGDGAGLSSPSKGWGYRSGYIKYPDSREPSSSSSRRGRVRGVDEGSAAGAAAADFVVIGKGGAGSYMQTVADLEDKEGGSFWEAAIMDEEGDEDEEYEEFEEGEDQGDDEDEVGVEEIASLMRELAEGLGEEEEEQQEGQQQPAAAAAAAWRSYYISRQAPPPQLGPVTLKAVPGKGRGVFTTAAVAAGDLLMVASPLALLFCEEGATPENEELAAALTAAVSATRAGSSGSDSSSGSGSGGLALWQQHALLQLRPAGNAGTAEEEEGEEAAEQSQAVPDLLQLLGDPADVAASRQHPGNSGSDSSGSSSSAEQQQQHVAPLPSPPAALPDADQVLKIVHANCTGEEFEDAALVLLRGSTSCGHLGVWPAAAMINHACCPNAHALLIGDKLVVRAAEDVPAGQQVTLSYLGPQLFAPASVRQQELRQQWGFDCSCSRCAAEARHVGSSSTVLPAPLSQLLLDTYTACQAEAEQLEAAVEAEDEAAIAALQGQLQGMQQQVEAGIRAAKPPANVRRWLQASVYDVYDLLSLCADQLPAAPPKAAGGKGSTRGKAKGPAAPAIETEALAACARIVGAVTPGSSAHVDLATEYMIRSEARFGEGHQEAADALRLCATAHVARFGPVGPGLLQLLMDTRAGVALL